jgi:hypothetical protein
MKLAALALGLALVAGACASSQTASADQAVTSTRTTGRLNVISTQEIRDSRAATVGDLIRQLRPSWNRNVATFTNNDPDPEAMNRAVAGVREIRFLSKSEAQNNWGSRYNEVIQILR